MTLPLATPEQTREVLAAIETMLVNLGESLARVVVAGPLNPEQRTRVQVALFTADGLAALVRDERARQER